MKCTNRLLAQKLKQQDEIDGKAKIEAWNLIKTEQPKLAELMTAISKKFGPNKATIVEIGGKVVVKSGEYLPVRLAWDGKLK